MWLELSALPSRMNSSTSFTPVEPFALDTALILPPSFETVFLILLALVAGVALPLWWGRFRLARRSAPEDRVPSRAERSPPGLPSPAPFVSIQLPISNEPPDLIEATLDHLARLAYPASAHEVLVIDNNTADPRLWKPVREQCRRLGFRFFHVEDLPGFKAGALNLALEQCSPRTELIFVVDADYQVAPDALARAVAELGPSGPDYVQLPQAYREITPPQRGLAAELGTFFTVFMEGSAPAGACLPTGTLLLLRRRALEAVGGWPEETITEDAHLGLVLQGAGFTGAYLPEIGGRGLLPLDGPGLRSQRSRWVAGNAQSLLVGLGRSLPRGRPHLLLLQLTAWWSFLGLPAWVLLLTAPAAGGPGWAATVAGALCLAEILATGAFFAVALRHRPPSRRLEAALVHLSLSRVSCQALLTFTSPERKVFERTDKNLGRAGQLGLVGLLMALLLVLAGHLHAGQGHSLAAVACGALALVGLLEPALDQHLARGVRRPGPTLAADRAARGRQAAAKPRPATATAATRAAAAPRDSSPPRRPSGLLPDTRRPSTEPTDLDRRPA